MTALTATPLLVAAALSPLVVVGALMAMRNWSAARAGVTGWATAIAVAALLFAAGGRTLMISQAKALPLAAFILYIIWAALALYHVVDEAGAFAAISQGVTHLTPDPTMQVLLLAWVFASFLQGVTGFGVPVAVVAPLLVGLGFAPIASVVSASIGHAWAVSFGSVGSSINALHAVTNVPSASVTAAAAAFLAPACLACGGLAVYACGGASSLRRGIRPVAVVGIVMAAVQVASAMTRLWPVSAFLAGLAGFGVTWLYARRQATGNASSSPGGRRALAVAASAYVVLLVIVLVQLIPAVAAVLDRVGLQMTFPATTTGLNWQNAAAEGRRLSVFGHPGALILYSSAIAYVIYNRSHRYAARAWSRIVRRTVTAARVPTVAVLSLVAMASVMADVGMTEVLAQALSHLTGSLLPAAAPMIGALGGFATGTNTSANVLFGPVVEHAARDVGLSPVLALAAMNGGGAIGSVLAPAKIVVGASTVGLLGREGEVLRPLLRLGGAVVVLLAVVAFVSARLTAP